MTQPLVTIITVNFNGVSYTSELLHSLQNIHYPHVEIIVLDNASTEDPTPLGITFPYIKLIRSAENLGFAGGNNLGIAEATGKYLLFLNNDTEVDPSFLGPLVENLESNPHIGVASPKILFFNSKDKKTLQYAGSTGINPYTGRGEKIGSFETDRGQYDDTRKTSLGHGAAMMVPMKVAREVGLMPDIYFLYYEEHDWFEMIKRKGYLIYYVGNSTVYHKESLTVGENSALKTYYMTRGRLMYIRRNTNGLKWLSSLLFFLLLSLPKNILKHLSKGEFQLFSAFVQGAAWHLNATRVHTSPFLQGMEGQIPVIVDAYPHPIKKFK